MKGIEYRTYN